jgi:diguanylate cyclase (GGDEF)-like protein
VVGYDLLRLSTLVSESAEEDERNQTMHGIQQILDGKRASAQVRIRGLDGQERWLAWSGMPSGERDHGGAIIATVDITALKDAQAMLALQATHDALTGLPNRRLLFDRLSRALNRLSREPGAVAVLFMDLDRFKPVNDRFGHDAGDNLLQVIAGRLQGAVRAADTVARVGGDEFVVILDSVSSREDATRVAAKIVEVVAEPVELDGGPASVGASIGIAFSRNAHDDPDALLRDADAAMYLAKNDDSTAYRFFDAEIGDHDTARSLVGKRHHVTLPRRTNSTS